MRTSQNSAGVSGVAVAIDATVGVESVAADGGIVIAAVAGRVADAMNLVGRSVGKLEAQLHLALLKLG